MGTLYLVATPIGNLEDISARALRILNEAHVIAAEDTRQTMKLLERFQISKPLISYHEHNKGAREARMIDELAKGDVALVSDAGTPALNDPGYELVLAALAAGFNVVPIPGPSAPVTALIVSGLPTDAFLYLGYLPRRGTERRKKLEEARAMPYTLIFLETPHRLLDALEDLLAVLGDRPMAAARELTKAHEEVVRGPISTVMAHFQAVEPRGEFTLVIGGAALAEPEGPWDEARLEAYLVEALERGERGRDLAARVAEISGWPSREIYQRQTRLRNGSKYNE